MANFFQGDNALSTLFEPKVKIAYGTFKIGSTGLSGIGENTWTFTTAVTADKTATFLETGTNYFKILEAGIYRVNFVLYFLEMRDSGNQHIDVFF